MRGAERGRAQAAAGIVAGAAAAGAVISLLAATQAARAVVTPPRRRREPVRVLSGDASARTITVRAVPEAIAPGTCRIVYAGGTALVGRALDRAPRSVEREVLAWRGDPPFEAGWVRFTSAPHLGPDDLGAPFDEIAIETELGPASAILVPALGRSGAGAGIDESGPFERVAIHVHGRAADLTEPLRGVERALAAGWSSIVPSYRNDAGAPRSRDGRFGLGATESRDVEAAIDEAARRGARRIALAGWSMGGAAVLDAALRTPHRELLAGILLESPATSWRDVLAFQGARLGLWPWVAPIARALLASPLAPALLGVERPVPMRRLEFGERADELRALGIPILVLHSAGDAVVPESSSARFVRAVAPLARYERFERGLHTRLWNADPARWERIVGEWFARLAADEAVTTGFPATSASASVAPSASAQLAGADAAPTATCSRTSRA